MAQMIVEGSLEPPKKANKLADELHPHELHAHAQHEGVAPQSSERPPSAVSPKEHVVDGRIPPPRNLAGLSNLELGQLEGGGSLNALVELGGSDQLGASMSSSQNSAGEDANARSRSWLKMPTAEAHGASRAGA